jgi:WD40 repeat protein
MVFRGETETEGLRNDAVDALDKLHLIRSELRGGSQWYELTHDRFIDSVRRSHERVLSNLQAGAAEVGQRLEEKAAGWDDSGRTKAGLLTQNELLEAQHWLKSPEAAALGFSEKVMTLVEASRAEAQARSARRRKVLTYALGTLCLIALVAFGIALWQSQRATAEKLRATKQSEKASRLREVAERKSAEATVDRDIILGRNLAASSLKYKNSNLDLALLLNLEAARIAEELRPKTRLQEEARTSLLAEAKGGLLGGLVFSPHVRTFLRGHKDQVRSVAFSPDGKILASGGYDGKVILWDLAGYPLSRPLSGHKGAIQGVAFRTPDGKELASSSDDGTVVLWDVEKQTVSKSLQGGGSLYGVAFSPNGKILACGRKDGVVVLWDMESGHQTMLPGHEGSVHSVAFSPDGKTLATGGAADRKIIFWNVATPKQTVPKRVSSVEDDYQVLCLAFSPDSKTLASGNTGYNITLWNAVTHKKLGKPLEGHANSVSGIAFSPNGATLVSASPDKTIRRWDINKRTQIGEPIMGSSEQIYALAFSKDGETLASGGGDGVIVLWNLTNEPLIAEHVETLYLISSVAFSPNGKMLAIGRFDGKVTVVGPNGVETLLAHGEKVTSVAFGPENVTLASASTDGSIMLHSWDGKTWNSPPKRLSKSNKFVNSIAFSRNNILASGGDDGVMLWDVAGCGDAASCEPLGSPLEHGRANTVLSVAFSPDGKKLASGGDDWEIVFWDVATRGQLGQPLKGHIYNVCALAFSPNGEILASGGGDTAVIFWDVATGRPLDPPFREHTGQVDSIAFSPDGKTLASGSVMDKSIILWDVATREPIGPLVTEDRNALYAMTFSPEGELVSAGSGLMHWDASLESLRTKADQVAARNLSPDEVKRFLGDRPHRPTSVCGLVKEADILSLEGDIKKAREVFEEGVEMAAKSGAAVRSNEVAWHGTLDKLPDVVLPACSRAIALAKDEDKANYRDTRGVALAMTGKLPEAIEDFQAYVTWSKTKEEKEKKAAEDASSPEEKAQHQNEQASWKGMREKREHWIVDLKSGRNPFDAATLMKLRREGSE